MRCELAGIECMGYSIELYWVANDHDARIPGRAIRSVPPIKDLPQADPLQLQTELDWLAEIYGEGQRELFSVFSLRKGAHKAILGGFGEEKEPRYGESTVVGPGESIAIPSQGHCAHSQRFCTEHGHASCPCHDPRPRQEFTERFPRHLDHFSLLPESERKLVHHWVTTLGPILIPVNGVENAMTSVHWHYPKAWRWTTASQMDAWLYSTPSVPCLHPTSPPWPPIYTRSSSYSPAANRTAVAASPSSVKV